MSDEWLSAEEIAERQQSHEAIVDLLVKILNGEVDLYQLIAEEQERAADRRKAKAARDAEFHRILKEIVREDLLS